MRSRAAFVLGLVALLSGVPTTAAVGQADPDRPPTVETDIEYASPGGTPLLLDVYSPKSEGPHPAAIVIHGGRWLFGDKQDSAGVAGALAGSGFVAFAINYRFASQAPFPAQLTDVQSAVQWVRDHASEYGVDPTRVVTLGSSAGGHLAALAATSGEGPTDQGVRVSAAVSWSGPMDLQALADARGGLEAAASQLVGCEDARTCQEPLAQASPITHLDPTDPPIFVANATQEPIPFDQAEAMAQAGDDSGVNVEVLTIDGSQHGFSYTRTAIGPTLEFLATELGAGVDTSPSPAGTVRPPREDRGEARGATPDPSRAWLLWLLLAVLAVGAATLAAVGRRWNERRRWG
jgi:acetyl esterase